MSEQVLRIQNSNGTYVNISKLCSYEVSYEKLWSSDTGRSMTGANKGTLVGIFPKIKIKIGQTTDSEMTMLVNLFNQAAANVQYYDSGKNGMTTASFYFGSINDNLKSAKHRKHEGFEISIIANNKRS